MGYDEVLQPEHRAVRRARRQYGLRDDLDLLLRRRPRVVPLVDVVEDDDVRHHVVELRSAHDRIEAQALQYEAAPGDLLRLLPPPAEALRGERRRGQVPPDAPK